MKEQIKIPALGESVTEATIASFLKKSGEGVQENEEIVELETEKVNQILYAPLSGVLTWHVKEGDTLPIGSVIGEIEGGKEAKPREEKKEEIVPEEKPIEKPQEKKVVPERKEKKIRQGSEDFLKELQGVSEEKKALPPTQPKIEEKRETRKPLSKIRKTIAERLVSALRNAAMLTTFNIVDMSEVILLRSKHQELFQKKFGVKLGFMSFFVKAVVESLKAFPEFNSHLEGDEIVEKHFYDISIAVGSERGLVVPVIRDADMLTFADIEKKIKEFAKKAKELTLTIDEMRGGNFTITNGGVYGSLLSTPILNPPQVGILGMHKIMDQPVVTANKEIVIRPMMYLALSYDHRVVDGKGAISFLVSIKEILEDPSRLFLFPEE